MSEHAKTDGRQRMLVVDSKRCHGCQACMVACSLVKEGQVIPSLARIQVVLDPFRGDQVIHYCHQCSDAPCAANCPQEAIHWVRAGGFWMVDDDLCVGCGTCVDVCPFEVVWLHPVTRLALKCDTCGAQPQCVESCPTGALTWEVWPDTGQGLTGQDGAQWSRRSDAGTD